MSQIPTNEGFDWIMSGHPPGTQIISLGFEYPGIIYHHLIPLSSMSVVMLAKVLDYFLHWMFSKKQFPMI